MGVQSSKTEGARPEQLDLYGVFDLRQRQKFSITVLSDLVTMLVDGNNLFNLAEVLNSPEGCNSLMTIIQQKLDKEFMTLQLPDPKRGSEISKVSFMPKSYYEKIHKSDEERRNYCQQFVRFIVRFTGLIAALTASIAYQQGAYIRLKDVTPEIAGASSSLRNRLYKDLQNKQLTFRPIPPQILSLLTAGKFKQITGDTRQLYTFGINDPIVVDINKGIVYNAQSSPTGVFGIMFTPRNPMGEQPQTVTFAQPQVQAPVLPLAPPRSVISGARGWNATSASTAYRPNPFNTGSTTGSILRGGTRRRTPSRKATRRNRQRGGDKQYFNVTLSTAGECEGDTCQIYKFVVDTEGTAYDSSGVLSSSGELSFESFSNKVQRYLATAPKYALESGSDLGFAQPSVATPVSRLSEFNKYKSAIRGYTDDNQPINPKEVTSPSFYRAFLLATAVANKQVTTSFCTDLWTGIMTETIPYALLQSLYYDSREGGTTIESSNELSDVAAKFLNNNIAQVSNAAAAQGGYEFSKLKFKDPKELAKGFCNVGNRIATSEQQYNILTNAHRKLRGLYDTHLGNVEKFVRKILSLKDMGYRKAHQIRIDPIFVTSKQGALETLEGFIKEARTLLANHYLEVENVYKTAIQDIGRVGMGVVPASAVEQRVPTLRTKNVEDSKVSSDPLKRGITGESGEEKVSETTY